MMSARKPSSNLIPLYSIGTETCRSTFQTSILQLFDQNNLINSLKKPRAKLLMNGNSQLDHCRSYLVLCHSLRLRVSARVQASVRSGVPTAREPILLKSVLFGKQNL